MAHKQLFLIGYMGSGKSTLGRRIARAAHWRWVDTDSLIEEREGATVADIFHYAGEAYFRRVEREVVEEILQSDEPAVVSTGGGLPIWGDNMERLNEAGFTVYLRRTAANIATRLSEHGIRKRPRLRGLSGEALVAFMAEDIAARETTYSRALCVIDCDNLSDDEIIARIMDYYANE